MLKNNERTDIHGIVLPSLSPPSIESAYQALQANVDYFDADRRVWRRDVWPPSRRASVFDKKTQFLSVMVLNTCDVALGRRQYDAAKAMPFFGRKAIDETATLLLGIVAVAGWDVIAARAMYGRLRGTRMVGDVWTRLPPRERWGTLVTPESDTLLCSILAAVAIGKPDEARDAFETWTSDERLLHPRVRLWKMGHQIRYDYECAFESVTQLLGVLVEHAFDPPSAKERYERLKRTPLFVSPGLWHGYLPYGRGAFGDGGAFSVGAALLDLLVQARLGVADAEALPAMPAVLDLSRGS